MIYLFLGSDTLSKDKQIQQIKEKHLPSKDAYEFDYESISAHKLNSDTLKQTLIALPTVAKQRLVVIRQAQKLEKNNERLLLECIESDPKHLSLIFDVDQGAATKSFLKKVAKIAKVIQTEDKAVYNVFDMTKAMTARKPADALKILSELYEQGDHPLQVMGGLVWYWGKNKNRVSQQRFNTGLEALQEADLNIKRSRMSPEFAVENAVVKLSSLIA